MLCLSTTINGRKLRLNLRSGEIWGIDGRTKKWEVKSVFKHGNYLGMSIGNKKYKFHRVIYKIWNPDWNIDDGSIKNNSIDHINGHTDNNQITNLRNVTNQQNCWNHTKAKGYCWDKRRKKWHAQIQLNGKKLFLGYFVLEEDAKNAYLEAKKIYHIID